MHIFAFKFCSKQANGRMKTAASFSKILERPSQNAFEYFGQHHFVLKHFAVLFAKLVPLN